MKATLSLILITTCLTAALSSCDRRDCKSTNPVFSKYTPETQEYKAELAKQIRLAGTDKLSYWINKYSDINDTPSLWINIQGDSLCAIGELHVDNWNGKLAGVKDVKGMGYGGAELVGLKIEVREHSGKTILAYTDHDYIDD